MSKKILSLVLVAILLVGAVFTFSACKDEKENIKAALICLHGDSSTYDKNFIDAFKQACANKGLTEADYTIITDIPEGTECYNKAADFADKGYDVVFANSFGHEAYMIQAAKEFSDVQFCHATGVKAHTENVANFQNAFASIYEGRYLAGVAAGLKLVELYGDAEGKVSDENAKIGYVGAWPYAEVVPVFLPEDAAEAFKGLLAVSHRPLNDKAATFKLLQKGVVYEDENLTIEAVPTRHAENEGRDFPSYGFSIRTRCGKHYLHAGDLKHDFTDFPAEYCTPETVCVCELTHYPWHCAEGTLKSVKLKRMIFSHIGNQWESGTVFDLPYPNQIAEDGDEFEI